MPEQSPQTKAALAIMQAAIDRENALKKQRRDRYSHGFEEKPTTHDELQEAMDRSFNSLMRMKQKEQSPDETPPETET